MSENPLVDIGVLLVMLGPLFLRWPVLLIPFLGVAGASVASLEWANSIHQYTVPAIFITLFGYVIAMFARIAGATE